MTTVPAYLLLTSVVTWNATDSNCMLYYDVFDFHSQMPHWPPLYLGFTRILAFICEGPYSYASLILIVISQQLVACGAITALAFSTSRIFWRRLIVVLAMLAYAPFFLYNQGIWAEGMVISLIILQATAALKLFCNERDNFSSNLLYYGSLLINTLIRNSAIIMGGLLPTLLLIQALRFRGSKFWNNRFLKSVLLSVVTVALAQGFFLIACTLNGSEYHSVIGRYACYWWNDSYWNKYRDSKAQLIAQMENMTADPLVRAAIPLVAQAKNLWVGAYRNVYRLLEEKYPNLTYEYYHNTTDKVLNQVAWLFFRTMNRPWMEGARQNFLKYFTTDESNNIFYLTQYSISNLSEPKGCLKSLGCSSGEANEVLKEKIRLLEASKYIELSTFLSIRNMLYVLCVLISLGYLFRIIPIKIVTFSIVLTALGFLHMIAISFLTSYVERFASFTSATLIVSISIILASFHYDLPSKN